MRILLKALLSIVFIVFCLTLKAQYKNFGLSIGYENSKNIIINSAELNFEEARPYHSLYAGMFYEISPSQGQNSRMLRPIPFISLELGGCWCGGYFNLPGKFKDSSYLEEFEYLVYRAEFALIGGFKLNNFKFLFGPEVIHPFYTAMKRENGVGYSDNSSDYEYSSLGYTLGIGYEMQYFKFDFRYQRLLTDYGVRYRTLPFEFSERQYRLTVGYSLFKRNKEKNLKSIFWE